METPGTTARETLSLIHICIDGKESELDMKSEGFNFITPVIEKGDAKNMRAFLEKVWDVYGTLGAGQLSNLTHQPDSPWFEVWVNKGGKNRKGTDIPDDLIQSYFKKKIAKPATPSTVEQDNGGR